MMYPETRLRRNRKTGWIRDLVAESNLRISDLVLPIFVVDGKYQKQEIEHMPGVYRLSIDELVKSAKEAEHRGIKMIALFPCIEESLKSPSADEAYNLDNLICKAVRTLKNSGVNIGICCDVALDPYTTHGHDGIMHESEIDNDKTIEALRSQAMTLAKAGADVIAPSDMMDGRVAAIRKFLDEENFQNTNIMAYAAKYNSKFYGPFRRAVKSELDKTICKATYQMDYRNSIEAMREIQQDVSEGADIIMIKPGMPYLDVIKDATQNFDVPIFAYQVSGEYAMLKLSSNAGIFDWHKVLIESLYSFKRAGARAIFTYGALDATEILD